MTEHRGQQPPHPSGTPGARRPGAMPPPPPAISGRHTEPRRVARPATCRDGPVGPRRNPAPTPPAAAQRTRVVVVDDHAMFRSGVKTEIGQRVAVVGEAADVDSAVAVIAETHPDVVLLDVHLPGGGGVEVLRRVHLVDADQKFLALSVSDAAEDVIGVIRGGARGYVTKSINGEELIDAIRRVSEGDAVFSPRLAGFVLDAFSGAIDLATIDEDLDRLSQREREVLRLIARGYAYKEVARELFISIKTVETHVSSVLRKLQLSNRHQLTRWATDRRLVLSRRSSALGGAAGDRSPDGEHDHAADEGQQPRPGGPEAADAAAEGDAAEEAADERADHADQQRADPAAALAVERGLGQRAHDESDQDPADDAHGSQPYGAAASKSAVPVGRRAEAHAPHPHHESLSSRSCTSSTSS